MAVNGLFRHEGGIGLEGLVCESFVNDFREP